MTQHLLLPSISLMSPLAAEVWTNCKCYLYSKSPFALWQKAKVSVSLRLWLVLISRKTEDTPTITPCGISKGRVLWMPYSVYVRSRRVWYFIYCVQTTVLWAALRQHTRHERHLHKSVLQVKVENRASPQRASQCSWPGSGKGGHGLCSAWVSWHWRESWSLLV